MNSKKFDVDGSILDCPHPVLLQARFVLDDEDDTLTIYDSVGPEYGKEKVFMDKTKPFIDFGEKGQPFHEGLYAFMPRGGVFYLTWLDA